MVHDNCLVRMGTASIVVSVPTTVPGMHCGSWNITPVGQRETIVMFRVLLETKISNF